MTKPLTQTMTSSVETHQAAGTPPQARIGEVLKSHGVITAEEADRIARHHVAEGIRFGEAAVKLGLISPHLLHLYLSTLEDGRTQQETRFGPEIVMLNGANSVIDEIGALRNLLTVRWFNHEDGAHTLALLSPMSGDGRSFVVANLAVSFAMAGMQTLLIDGDLRNPKQHAIFGLDQSPGLSDYLAGSDIALTLHKIAGHRLVVMPAGGQPRAPELLSSPRLPELALEAGRVFDAVLLDTPAGHAHADYEMLCSAAKGALFVMRRDVTPVKETKRMLARCADYGARVVGSLLLDSKP